MIDALHSHTLEVPVTQAVVYCMAVAAKDKDVDVYWLSVMSNHDHPGAHRAPCRPRPSESRPLRCLLAQP